MCVDSHQFIGKTTDPAKGRINANSYPGQQAAMKIVAEFEQSEKYPPSPPADSPIAHPTSARLTSDSPVPSFRKPDSQSFQ